MDTVLDSMRALIALTPERWLGLARALPVELLARPAAEHEWSAVDCLQHLVDSERVFQFRVQAFLAGRDFPDFNPDTDGSRHPVEQGTSPGAQTALALAVEFARLRRESLLMLEKLSPADLERKARHAGLGMLTVALPFLLVGGNRMEEISLQRLWHGFHLVATRNSIYGNLAVVETDRALQRHDLAFDRQPRLAHCDIKFITGDSRQIGLDHDLTLLVVDINRRRPGFQSACRGLW